MKAKSLKRIVFWILVAPLLVFASTLLIVYAKQNTIVQSQITALNTNYKG